MLNNSLLNGRKIIVYGLGIIGKALIPYLRQDANIHLSGVCTSGIYACGIWEYDGIELPIRSIYDWKKLEPDAAVLIATTEKYHKEIIETCKTAGFIDIVPVWPDLIDDAKLYQNIQYRKMPPEEYAEALKEWYRAVTGDVLDLDNPKTYNEKIQWLKLYDSTPLKTRLADKYLVRSWVREKIGEEYLIPLLGVWDSFDDIDFDKLPDQFVLKANHGCSWNIIVKNKEEFDKVDAKQKFNTWMKMNYAFYSGFELQYMNIPPKIIAEQYMEDDITQELRDYKFFCFDGDVKALFIATARNDSTTETKFDFFDVDFKHLPFTNGHPNADPRPAKPSNFSKMKELAEKLAEGFSHVRVDFYEINGKVYFGEYTFSHWSGLVPFEPKVWDKTFGDWIKLPPPSPIPTLKP